MPTYRFALELQNGESAAPSLFITRVPAWRIGDTFDAGTEHRRFRILVIEPARDEHAMRAVEAVWKVEPVEG